MSVNNANSSGFSEVKVTELVPELIKIYNNTNLESMNTVDCNTSCNMIFFFNLEKNTE